MQLPQEDVLDDALPDFVVDVEVEADDQARDQHDRGAGDHLRLGRPVDLLQFGVRLPDEAEEPVASLALLLRRGLDARAAVARRRDALRGSAPARRRRRGPSRGLAGLAPGAPLRAGLASHLAGLPVRCVLATPAAVLAELDAVGVVPLRLGRLIVAPLALGACERDPDSYACLCHLFSSLGQKKEAAESRASR